MLFSRIFVFAYNLKTRRNMVLIASVIITNILRDLEKKDVILNKFFKVDLLNLDCHQQTLSKYGKCR